MYITSIILQGFVLGTQVLMVAVGLYLVSAASRVMHLGIGAIGASSAYALYWGITLGWPLWTAILLAFCVAFLLGLSSGKILEPFAVRHEPLLGLLVSFAFGMILESLIAIFFGTDGKSLQTGVLSVVHLGKAEVDLPGIITIFLGAMLAFLAWVLVQFTKMGRLLRSVAENSSLTASLGVNNKSVRYLAYGTSALLTAVVLSLTGWHTTLTPLMGFQLTITAFVALLMGGISDLRGTILASYVLAVIPSLVIGFTNGFSENWRLVFVFCIAAIVFAFRPQGIFAKRLREA